MTLYADYLDDRTRHGDPTLQHGYAMTIHVAQGLTVDQAFVLAGAGLNQELGYTALSRGRHSNRLYAAREPDTSRVEYAPADAHRIDPIARLATALGTSSATTLAIDAGHEPTAHDRLAKAQHENAQAAARRRAAEAARGGWLPGRRRELAQLRDAEALAAHRVERVRREQLELAHGARPFATDREHDASFARTADLILERRLQRENRRDAGRGLER